MDRKYRNSMMNERLISSKSTVDMMSMLPLSFINGSKNLTLYKTMYNLKPDSRYGDPTFLTQSTLNNFASYDTYGTPTYNIHAVINPTRPESDFITIGLACDQHLLE